MQRRPATLGQTRVMGNHDQRGPLLTIEFEQQIGDALAGGGVQVARRFVGEQDVRLAGKGPGDRHALLLAAGKLSRIMGHPLGQTDPLEQRGGALACIGTAMKLQRQHHVFQCGEATEQLEGLEYETHVIGAQRRTLVFVESRQSAPGQLYLAVSGQVEAGKQAQEGGFSRARGTDDRHTAAAGDAQAHVIQDGQLRFRGMNDFAKVARNDHAFRHGGMPMSLLKKLLAPCLLCLLAWPVSAQNILVVGDSISAAFGLEIEEGWVYQLQERLEEQGYPHRVVNASVSGDTTAGGLARLPRLLQEHEPALVIIELGGNDGLRAMPPANMQQNLSQMVKLSTDADADAILLGMMIPPNYGLRYTQAFNQVFVDVAEQWSIPLLPFLLEGVGDVPALMQADRIHPTAEAQPILLDNAWPLIRDWLEAQPAEATAAR